MEGASLGGNEQSSRSLRRVYRNGAGLVARSACSGSIHGLRDDFRDGDGDGVGGGEREEEREREAHAVDDIFFFACRITV